MTKIYLTPRSPFARRISLALRRVGVLFQEEYIDIFNPDEKFLKIQPAATVPVLEIENELIIPDSSLILDYLHEKYDEKIWGSENLNEKIASVWCVAIMTNAVNYFLELQKKSPDEDTLSESKNNVQRLALKCAALEKSVWINKNALTQAGWDYAVALEYVKFRMGSIDNLSIKVVEDILEIANKEEFFVSTKPKQG